MAGRITEVLGALERDDPGAREELLGLVHGELRRLAARQMRGQPPHHTLQPTALLHEAWMRLAGRPGTGFRDRTHFFAVAAAAMRSILVDIARGKAALKRGGARGRRVALDERSHAAEDPSFEVLAVHEALERLEDRHPEAGRLIELRFFCGLTMEETARSLGMSTRSAYVLWEHGRAWLYREMAG